MDEVLKNLPATAAVLAAIISGWFAFRARKAEAEALRVRQLEERLAAKKYEVYAPMIEMLRRVLDQDKDAFNLQSVSDFSQWISIYGSDEAVQSFRRFMQGAYNDAPGPVAQGYAEFVLSARRDIGTQASKLTAEDVLGIRIKDLYTREQTYDLATMPFDELCAEHDWQPPWTRTRRQIAEARSAIDAAEAKPRSTDEQIVIRESR